MSSYYRYINEPTSFQPFPNHCLIWYLLYRPRIQIFSIQIQPLMFLQKYYAVGCQSQLAFAGYSMICPKLDYIYHWAHRRVVNLNRENYSVSSYRDSYCTFFIHSYADTEATSFIIFSSIAHLKFAFIAMMTPLLKSPTSYLPYI